MRWLVAISVVRAGEGPVLPGVPFSVATTAIGDELVALDAARYVEREEIPSKTSAEPDPATLPPLHELRMAAIAAVVATLTDADYKPTGYPKTDVLASKLGWKPAGGEILRLKRTA